MRLVFAFVVVSTLAVPAFAQDKKKKDAADDATIKGEIVANDAPDKVRNHPCKIHTFKLSKDKLYVIDLESNDFDAYLRIEDSSGKELAKDDDSGDKLNARIRFNPPKDGNYQIIATTFGGGTGAYTLKVRVAAAAAPAKAIALKMADGQASHQGEISKDDANDRVRNRPCKIYSVKFEAGKTYVIDLES